ncbi:MAG TPA: hypothetical protein VE175_01940 [Woeseiaceae bacterium]|jgi:hypothetical protein|nr:hypothetical protein [Woeseiaceae bacterium]
MNKTFWIGFVVVYVVVEVIGFLVHGIWLDETYRSLADVFRPEAEMNNMMWVMFLSAALSIFIFCYIFTKNYEGKGIAEGLRYGFLIGLLMAVPMALDDYVIYPLPLNLAAIWLVVGLINFMIAGAVFSVIYKPSAPAPATAAA